MQSEEEVQRLPTTTDQSSVQQFLAISFALSYKHNSRNIEHPWYGPWNHVLLDIVKDTRNLVVFPQFVVWASPEGYDDLGGEKEEAEQESQPELESEAEAEAEERDRKPEESEPEPEAPYRPRTRLQVKKGKEKEKEKETTKQLHSATSKTHPQAPSTTPTIAQNPPDSVDESAPAMDYVSVRHHASTSSTSVTGSVVTAAAPKGSSTRIADFAILKLFERKTTANNPTKSAHIKAGDCTVKAFVEIKRRASRKLEGDKFTSEMKSMIEDARRDVTAQAALFFETHTKVKSVIAIACSGDYWSSTTLKRQNIDCGALEEMSIDLTYNEQYVSPSWSAPVQLEESMQKLLKLFEKIRR